MITASSKMTIIRTVCAVILFFFPVAEGGADQKYLLHNDAKVERHRDRSCVGDRRRYAVFQELRKGK